jgi:hypothetical protein
VFFLAYNSILPRNRFGRNVLLGAQEIDFSIPTAQFPEPGERERERTRLDWESNSLSPQSRDPERKCI